MSLDTREMNIKATLRFHFTPFRIAVYQENKIQILARVWERRNPFPAVEGSVNWHRHYGSCVEVSLKLEMELLYDPVIRLPGIFPKGSYPAIDTLAHPHLLWFNAKQLGHGIRGHR